MSKEVKFAEHADDHITVAEIGKMLGLGKKECESKTHIECAINELFDMAFYNRACPKCKEKLTFAIVPELGYEVFCINAECGWTSLDPPK